MGRSKGKVFAPPSGRKSFDSGREGPGRHLILSSEARKPGRKGKDPSPKFEGRKRTPGFAFPASNSAAGGGSGEGYIRNAGQIVRRGTVTELK